MPTPLELDDADGILTIALAGREAVELDLIVAQDAFAVSLDGWAINKNGTPEERVAALKDYYARLQGAALGLGLGTVTGTTAERVRQAVDGRLEELRKKADGASPAPTP